MDLQEQIADEPATRSLSSRERGTRAPGRLTELVRRLGLPGRETEARRLVDLVCAESLEADAGWSSLNADGTPVQFALSLREGRKPAFEFVGEAFREGMDFAARRAFGLERMSLLSEAIGVHAELDAARPHLYGLVDGGSAREGEDPAGAFWIGASLEPGGVRSMTVYANARHGAEASRWSRLAAFLESVAKADWLRILAVARAGGLKPLGAGVRITERRRPHARAYFGAYGVRPEEYRRMFREAGSGEAFDDALGVFFEETLRDEALFPTRSAVFSFGSDGGEEWSPKLELCGHCAWRSEGEAQVRCSAWLSRLGVERGLYRDAVAILGGDRPVHAYAGVGMSHEEGYASIYLNPGRGVL